MLLAVKDEALKAPLGDHLVKNVSHGFGSHVSDMDGQHRRGKTGYF